MNKLGKIALGLAFFLLLSGGLLAMTGWFMGGDTSMEYTRNGHTVVLSPFGIRSIYRGSETPNQARAGGVNVADAPSFHTISIDVSLADVTLMQSDSYSVELDWSYDWNALEYSLEDGVLKVWDKNRTSPRAHGENRASVTICYPDGTKLGGVDVTAAMGEVDLYGLTAEQLTVKANMGSVTLDGGKLGSADLDLDMGELEASGLEVSGLTQATNRMGSLYLEGSLRDMDLNCDMGSITVYTDLAQSEYRYDLDVNMGSLSYGNLRSDGKAVSGGSGDYSVTARCSMGDMLIHFD